MTKTEYIKEFGYPVECNMEVLTLGDYGYIHDFGLGGLIIEMVWYRLN